MADKIDYLEKVVALAEALEKKGFQPGREDRRKSPGRRQQVEIGLAPKPLFLSLENEA
jgi:hypothetical protein